MDLHLPGISGITATERITREFPSIAVLVLTMTEHPSSIQAALGAVSKGQMIVGTGATEAVRHFFDTRPSSAFPQLRERELDVLRLLATGADNATIARQLFLAEKTVRNRVSDILLKLGVATRAQAIARARDAGLGEPI